MMPVVCVKSFLFLLENPRIELTIVFVFAQVVDGTMTYRKTHVPVYYSSTAAVLRPYVYSPLFHCLYMPVTSIKDTALSIESRVWSAKA